MDAKTPLEHALGPQLAALRALEQRTRELALVSAHRRTQSVRRLKEVERDLARVALVVRAIADLAIARGLFTDMQLRAQFDRADFADGVFDAALDPKLVAPQSGRGTSPRRASKSNSQSKPRRKAR
ncbi:MAG: hypothetical protein FJ294_04285 [Planctomycetes bacterium]|nr:hypothetical protein [Planctomycetota bacterium]